MILKDSEVTERMESPMNLMNRLRELTTKKTSNPSNSSNHSSNHGIVSIPPTSSEVIDDLEEKLAYGSIKSKAAGIMIAAMDELKLKIVDVQKPEQLARIAESMSKVVNAETKDNKDKLTAPQFVLYAPQFHNESHYEVIHTPE